LSAERSTEVSGIALSYPTVRLSLIVALAGAGDAISDGAHARATPRVEDAS
jgi:hypothetical protein